MNAPEAGTIKEFLVNEEDTVTVGQDLVRMEPGGKPSGSNQESAVGSKDQAKDEPKDEPKEEQKPAKTETKAQQNETTPAAEAKQTEKPAASKSTGKETQPQGTQATTGSTSAGGREERRVCPEIRKHEQIERY